MKPSWQPLILDAMWSSSRCLAAPVHTLAHFGKAPMGMLGSIPGQLPHAHPAALGADIQISGTSVLRGLQSGRRAVPPDRDTHN